MCDRVQNTAINIDFADTMSSEEASLIVLLGIFTTSGPLALD
jgi:hypothetical protein